jgi:hypothetical protein
MGWAVNLMESQLMATLQVLGSLVWDSGALSMSVAALTFAFSALFVKLIAGRCGM